MAEDENNSNLQTRIIGFYQAVSTDAKLRDASSKAEEIMDEFGIEASMREDIFKLVDAAYKKGEELDPESQRLLEKERKSYIRNGLGIPAGPQRDRFKEIKKRLSQIQIEFQKNLNEENGGIWFSKKELEGVPDDVVEGFEKGTGENEGKLRFTFKYPDLFPALKFALDSDVRKKIFIENENKVSCCSEIDWCYLLTSISAIKTSLYSRKLLFSAMRLHVFSDTQTMRRSESKTKWRRLQRQ